MVPARRSLWHEPRPAAAPPIGRLDWLVAGGFVAVALVEGLLRPDLAWRPLLILLALALAPALLWRRRHPLAAAVVGWGVVAVLSILHLTAPGGDVDLFAMMAVLVLLYSLVRWGSGRDIILGTGFVAAVVALGMTATATSWAEVVGGGVLLLSVAALAAVFRYRADLWDRQQREIRNMERVELARELHDTVAHHVSAIAVQAQAGRVIAGVEPAKAVAVLSAIESEASRALAEMRSMVQVLRDEDPVDFAPQRGVADLPSLARADATPIIEVVVAPSVPQLAPPVDAAIYRLARESVTNADRHARGATRVAIDVRRQGDQVRLCVSDDGQIAPGSSAEPGFGLVGMAERTQLLGGSFAAGPRPQGGWVVEAVLPIGARS